MQAEVGSPRSPSRKKIQKTQTTVRTASSGSTHREMPSGEPRTQWRVMRRVNGCAPRRRRRVGTGPPVWLIISGPLTSSRLCSLLARTPPRLMGARFASHPQPRRCCRQLGAYGKRGWNSNWRLLDTTHAGQQEGADSRRGPVRARESAAEARILTSSSARARARHFCRRS